MKELVDQLTESEWVKLIGLFLLLCSLIEYIAKLWISGKKTREKIRTDDSYRDKVIILVSVIVGYLIPVFFLWITRDNSWLSWWVIPKVIAIYIFISNVLLWWIIRKMMKIVDEIERSPASDNSQQVHQHSI